jgi:hypothetical protein
MDLHHVLLVMNTTLGLGSVTEGFRQWRASSNDGGHFVQERGEAIAGAAPSAAHRPGAGRREVHRRRHPVGH